MSYFLNYVLGWPSPSNLKADLGTITHAVLETLAICKKRTQFNKRSTMKITQEPLGDFSFTDAELSTEAFVNKVLDRSFEFYKSKPLLPRFLQENILKEYISHFYLTMFQILSFYIY
jgi:hypothetical protein